MKPVGRQNVLEWVVDFTNGIIKNALPDEEGKQFGLLAFTLFVFIFTLQNQLDWNHFKRTANLSFTCLKSRGRFIFGSASQLGKRKHHYLIEIVLIVQQHVQSLVAAQSPLQRRQLIRALNKHQSLIF